MSELTKKRIAAPLALIMILAVILGSFCGCAGRNDPITKTGFYFDTYVSISLYDVEKEKANGLLNQLFAVCIMCDKIYDMYSSDSDIYRINHANGQPVTVSKYTGEMLTHGITYSAMSVGTFDISCGALTSLWVSAADTLILPDDAAITAARGTIDYNKIEISEDNTTVKVPAGIMIDAGGVAKGYIADKLKAIIVNNEVENALINLGGNIYCVGDKMGENFKIAIQSPFDSEKAVGMLTVSDTSVSTAGTYERCFDIDGKTYHHIIDLTTGYPAESGLVSVTIISESSTTADSLATICLLLGEESGMMLVESILGVEAVMVTSDGDVRLSSGAGKYFRESE